MKTQLSRISFDPTKRYNGVFQQMGRMLTDADWNELGQIDGERVQRALLHTVLSGTPRDTGVIRRDATDPGSDVAALHYGDAVVEGISARLVPAVVEDTPADGSVSDIRNQADFPGCPLPEGDHRLYLDVWERTVTALEDIALIDPALNGADTCTRRQVMCQLKWCATDIDPEDPEVNPKTGAALLSLELREGSTDKDLCDPCAEELVLQEKIGNYLFRVEIHRVDYDGAGQPSRVTLKWSSENGAEQHHLDALPPGFGTASWCYEFFSGSDSDFASEKHLGRHFADGFSATFGELVHGFPSSGSEPANLPLVRRWDGYASFDLVAGQWQLDNGFDRNIELSSGLGANTPGHVTNGSTVTLVLDALTLTLALENNTALAGDYWQAAVRESVHALDPLLLDDARPNGIEHHYLTIGTVVDGELTLFDSGQCRRFEFPPLTDIRAGDVCYDNSVCDMPNVDTVQEALDHLCQQRDLRWHNKHLHGWGIVCGLIVECCADHTEAAEETEGSARDRRSVCVTPGYALTCEGDDVVLKGPVFHDVPVMDMIDKLAEESGGPLLDDGAGTFCLRIERGEPQPTFVVEPWTKENKYAWLEGTLLMDFYEHCLKDLVDALTEEIRFQDDDELEELEDENGILISDQRRKTISVFNLIAWFLFGNHGHFVWTSLREHQILLAFYNRLRELLRSRTFCAMFQDEEFPDYPFAQNNIDTIFSRGDHTRLAMHPDKKTLYSYGGTDSSIHRFDLESKKLVEVLEMPAAKGAEITALCFSNDGSRLYACAAVRGTDTLFGAARIGDTHEWEQSSVLCDILIAEMIMGNRDKDLIYATGRNKGLYKLEPEVIAADTKPQLTPFYSFPASGQLVIDHDSLTAWCGAADENADDDGLYQNLVQCNLASTGEELSPQVTAPLRNIQGQSLSGSGNLAMSPGDDDQDRGARLYCITRESATSANRVSALALPLSPNGIEEISGTGIGNSDLWLHWHESGQRLLVAVEGECRLHPLNRDALHQDSSRTPVQVGPVDIAASDATGAVYTLNFVSKTITVIPADQLTPNMAFNSALEDYRYDILLAFWGLVSNVLQYLKDCFCHHLLVKCPTCDDDSKLWLATVEIRDNQVYKICNFDKRKTVKSFPTVDYWASLIPILPLIKQGIARFCCAVLPDVFGGLRDKLLPDPEDLRDNSSGNGGGKTGKSVTNAKTLRETQRTYNRTDKGALWQQQKKSLDFYGKTLADSGKQRAKGAQAREPGVSKQTYIGSDVETTIADFEKRGIEVGTIDKYDERYSGSYARDFAGTPQVIAPGARVNLIEKDGVVQFYHLETTPKALTLPEAELRELEVRKAALDLDKAGRDLKDLETQKSQTEAEITALRTQLDQVRSERDQQQAMLLEMSEQNREMATGLTTLRSDLDEIRKIRDEVNSDIARDRPVRSIDGVTPEIDKSLRELDIRSVEELSRATPAQLARAGIDQSTAKKINAAAKSRLRGL